MLAKGCKRCCLQLIKTGGPSKSLHSETLRTLNIGKPRRPDLAPKGAVKLQAKESRAFDDAYKIADIALNYLRNDDIASVERLISDNHDLALTTTWNFLIRHQMQQGRVNAALTAFQQMKKRQHFPTVYTYTLLLTGIASHFKAGGEEKLELVVSALLQDKRTKPTLIHLNAALQVCKKLENLRMAYEMIQKFQDADVEELSIVTYSILFEMLRDRIQSLGKADTRTPAKREFSPTLRMQYDDAISIWQDVEESWRSGKLTMDAHCVATFARAMKKGSLEDIEFAVAAICRVCDLPQYDSNEAAAASTTSTSTKPGKSKGNRVDFDDMIQSVLLDLTGSLENSKVSDHYWSLVKALGRDVSSEKTYQARLRALMGTQKSDEALRIVKEMEDHAIPMSSTTLFLLLQCHLTRESNDLARVVTVVRKYAKKKGDNEIFDVPVLTTICKFFVASKDMSAMMQIITVIDTFNWQKVALNVQSIPHQKERLRKSLLVAMKKADQIGRRTKNKGCAILMKGFARRSKAVLKRFYPQDIETLTKLAQGEYANEPDHDDEDDDRVAAS